MILIESFDQRVIDVVEIGKLEIFMVIKHQFSQVITLISVHLHSVFELIYIISQR